MLITCDKVNGQTFAVTECIGLQVFSANASAFFAVSPPFLSELAKFRFEHVHLFNNQLLLYTLINSWAFCFCEDTVIPEKANCSSDPG